MAILIIAEKKTQANDILDTLDAEGSGKRFDYHHTLVCSYGKIIITWGNGHIYEVIPPDITNPKLKFWNLADLPILIKGDLPLKSIKPTAKQVITRFTKYATEIVNACDPGREGELIFDEIRREIITKNNNGNCRL